VKPEFKFQSKKKKERKGKINEIKVDKNKQLCEFQEKSNKVLNETKKTMQTMQEKFNKDTEILKKI
jgi:hypothetical protein